MSRRPWRFGWDELWWDWIDDHYDDRVDLLPDPRDDPRSPSFEAELEPLIESQWDELAEGLGD